MADEQTSPFPFGLSPENKQETSPFPYGLSPENQKPSAPDPKTGKAPGDPSGMLSKPDFSFSPDAAKALEDPGQFLTSHQKLMQLQEKQIQENAQKRRMQFDEQQQHSQQQQQMLGQAANMMEQSKPQPYVPPDTRADMGAWLGIVGAAAALMSGKTRRSQMFALAGFTGAINGFMQGKKEESEHHFKVWQANQQLALQNNAQDLKRMQFIMQAQNLDHDQKMAQLELLGSETQDSMLLEMARQKNLQGIGQYFDSKAQLHQKNQESYIKMLTAIEKLQAAKDNPKSPSLNTPAGIQQFQKMLEAEKDPIKKKQMIWEFKSLHGGGSVTGPGEYPEPEAAKAKESGGGGWLSRLFGGGGASAGGPGGDGSSPSAPLPMPSSAAEIQEGKWYNTPQGVLAKGPNGKMYNESDMAKLGQ